MRKWQQPEMPENQKAVLSKAFLAYKDARDPRNPQALSELASVTNSAHSSGWSRRSIAIGLGISTERVRLLAEQPGDPLSLPRYAEGAPFPQAAVRAWNTRQQRIERRAEDAEQQLVAVLRSAHRAGWPFEQLAQAAGDITGERLRQLAESDIDTEGVKAPEFPEFVRPVRRRRGQPAERGELTAEEKGRMRELAKVAVNARALGLGPSRAGADAAAGSLAVRKASEELSAMIIAAKERNVTWADLDEACGYRRGGARARATRHGYGSLPLIAHDLVGHAELFEQPQHTLRAGIVEMMNCEHDVPFNWPPLVPAGGRKVETA